MDHYIMYNTKFKTNTSLHEFYKVLQNPDLA